MAQSSALFELGRTLGRFEANVAALDPATAEVAALRHVADVWRVYCRDSGPGHVGPAHEPSLARADILETDDITRRNALLTWLRIHGHGAVAVAAKRIAIMVDAVGVFDESDRALLAHAEDVLDTVPHAALMTPATLIALVTRLRADPQFAEGRGETATRMVGGRAVSHFVAAEPGGCWSLNVTLAARRKTFAISPTGLFTRALFKRDLNPDDIEGLVLDQLAISIDSASRRFATLERTLTRGIKALGPRRANSRAIDVWGLHVAFGRLRRAHLQRALGLSRAGATLQLAELRALGLTGSWAYSLT